MAVLATGNWGIVEATSAAVSAFILLVGVFFAQRYGKRADVVMVARLFDSPKSGLALEVAVEVKSVGIQKLRLVESDGQTPRLIVYDVIDDGVRFQNYFLEQIRPEQLVGQYVGPGETVRCNELVHLREPAEGQTGWQVEISFEARNPIARWTFSTWTASAFVPLGGYVTGETVDYTGEDNGTTSEASNVRGAGDGEGVAASGAPQVVE